MVLGYGKLTADGPSYAAYAAMRAARLGGLGVKAGPTSVNVNVNVKAGPTSRMAF